MKQQRKSENGQVLVLLVLGIVALLGFTALAIDGGMVYSDRRHAQSAADASSLAGGGAAALSLDNNGVTYQHWNCSSAGVVAAKNEAKTAAISRAGDNNYTIDTDIADQNGVTVSCGQQFNGSWLDKYLDIRTLITADTETSFAQLVFGGPLRNTVEAVTRVRPRAPLAYGNAIVALAEDCPNSDTGGVHFEGGIQATVTGGGIFSNACLRAGGTSTDVDVEGGYQITCVPYDGSDCYKPSGSPAVDPTPQEGSMSLPPSSFEAPAPTADCASLPDRGNYDGDGTIEPGRYSQITINNGDHVMGHGLYCLTGNNPNNKVFSVTGGGLTGNGVTIYINNGSLDMGGNAFIDMKAPPAPTCTWCPPAMPGMLIYLDGSGEVSLQGSSENIYLGVVYAPDGTIDVGGTADETSKIHAQLIGHTVKLHGDVEVIINFNGDDTYTVPAALELYK